LIGEKLQLGPMRMMLFNCANLPLVSFG